MANNLRDVYKGPNGFVDGEGFQGEPGHHYLHGDTFDAAGHNIQQDIGWTASHEGRRQMDNDGRTMLDRLRRSGDDGAQQKLFNERIRGNFNNVLKDNIDERDVQGHSSQPSAAFDHDSLFEQIGLQKLEEELENNNDEMDDVPQS